MNPIVKRFLEIINISRCSFKTKKMRDYIIEFSKSRGYKITIDSFDNILVFKDNPKLSLQAHYDMVCVGDAPNIEPVIEGDTLRAKNSSLGADNGIAIAMMLELIDRGVDAEYLFTNDEEVGLIGAKNLELNIKSKYILNLDSEDEAEVYIGCAGGADIVATIEDELIEVDGKCYEVSIKGLPGGHSGVDIDKAIPNAIKELFTFINSLDEVYISAIYAGERRNSIPSNAVAIIVTTSKIVSNKMVEIRELNESPKVFKKSQAILDLVDIFPHGVVDDNREFKIPNISINLAQINSVKSNKLELIATTRAMDSEGLESINSETISILNSFNFITKIEDNYPAWRPDINSFTKIVKKVVEKEFGKCELKAIHAGLECGVLSKKFSNIDFVSIGPNIRYPHSKREYVEINSVTKTFKVVEELISIL